MIFDVLFENGSERRIETSETNETSAITEAIVSCYTYYPDNGKIISIKPYKKD